MTEHSEGDQPQAQLRAIAGDLVYWKGGLKVLKQARLPKWRGYFQWQIEARIEALQTAYARVRAEAAEPDGCEALQAAYAALRAEAAEPDG